MCALCVQELAKCMCNVYVCKSLALRVFRVFHCRVHVRHDDRFRGGQAWVLTPGAEAARGVAVGIVVGIGSGKVA